MKIKKIIQFFIICFLIFFSYNIYKGYKSLVKNPGGLNENQIDVFFVGHNMNERDISILYNPERFKYEMKDVYLKKRPEIRRDPHYTVIESDVYDYEIERNLFYDDKMCYVLGREGFWIIQAVPFSITVLKRDLSDEYLNKKFDHPIWKDVPITKLNSEKDLSEKEFKIYKKLNRRLMLKNKT